MEPGVIAVSADVVRDLGVATVVRGTPPVLFRMAGVTLPEGVTGVTRELDIAGVTRPDDIPGVTLPLIDGVVRPLRVEATEDGRDTIPLRIAGGESLLVATKTPQFRGQEKYCTLEFTFRSARVDKHKGQLTRQRYHCSCPSQQTHHQVRRQPICLPCPRFRLEISGHLRIPGTRFSHHRLLQKIGPYGCGF